MTVRLLSRTEHGVLRASEHQSLRSSVHLSFATEVDEPESAHPLRHQHHRGIAVQCGMIHQGILSLAE